MIVIVALALRIAKQARTAVLGVQKVREQTAELGGIAQINDSGVRIDPALGSRAAKGRGWEVIAAALSGHAFWVIALAIGFGAALIVAILLIVLVRSVGNIHKSVGGLLALAGKVAANTSNIPQLEATAPVLAQIVEEAVVQHGYMNALTDGYGGI